MTLYDYSSTLWRNQPNHRAIAGLTQELHPAHINCCHRLCSSPGKQAAGYTVGLVWALNKINKKHPGSLWILGITNTGLRRLRYIKKKTQTYVVGKQKSTMLFFGGGKSRMCKNVHTQQDEENKALKDDLAYTQRNTFSSQTHQREGCLTVPGGPMWFGTVILLWHLWSLLPNPNFKQTLLTCLMFLGRSCKAKSSRTERDWRDGWWRKDEEGGGKRGDDVAKRKGKRDWVSEKAD